MHFSLFEKAVRSASVKRNAMENDEVHSRDSSDYRQWSDVVLYVIGMKCVVLSAAKIGAHESFYDIVEIIIEHIH